VAVRLVDSATVTSAQLLAWMGTRLSDYKTPRRVFIVDDLPRTGTNKLQRSELVERLRDRD